MKEPGLAVVLWDAVDIDGSGNLVSSATFVRVLEELRHQTPVLLFCGGFGVAREAHNVMVVPMGVTPSLAALLRRPVAFKRQIRRTLREVLDRCGSVPPLLLVDAILPNYIAARAALGRRAFLYLRGDDAGEARWRHTGLAWIAGVVHSLALHWIRRQLMYRLPVIGAGSRPLPACVLRGIDVFPFFPSTLNSAEIAEFDRATAERGLDQDPLRIIWVGRMTRIKRVDLLITAASHFATTRGAVVELELFGDGPELNRLKKLARQASTSLRTLFRGQVSAREVMQRIPGALCLAITSKWEGFPKVLPEALSVGLPIVSVDVGSISAFVEANDVGIVVRGGHKLLSHGFASLASAPERWAELSRNARRVAATLALDLQCRALLQHLREFSA